MREGVRAVVAVRVAGEACYSRRTSTPRFFLIQPLRSRWRSSPSGAEPAGFPDSRSDSAIVGEAGTPSTEPVTRVPTGPAHDDAREPETIGRVWIGPFVDAGGVYREASWVRIVIAPAEWRIP